MPLPSLQKPSRLARDVHKWERQVQRETLSKREKRAADAAWSKLSGQVRERDKSICRVCTCQTTRWGKGDPRLWTQCHHIVFRSANGPSVESNLITVCGKCHDAIHRYEINVTGTADYLTVRQGNTVNVSDRQPARLTRRPE